MVLLIDVAIDRLGIDGIGMDLVIVEGLLIEIGRFISRFLEEFLSGSYYVYSCRC